jgi:caffeoyl-CoA O-methyltransferase
LSNLTNEQSTADYLHEVFGAEDPQLAGLMDRAIAHGLPPIAVSSEVGRLLKLLTSTTRGKLAIEVGTLAGYSGIWIARGLAPDGRLITIEKDPVHAAFAREEFGKAGVGDRVEVCIGAALDVLPQIARRLGAGSVDVVFLDAMKEEYPRYWELVRPLISPGGLILADNVLGSSEWTIADVGHPARKGAHAFSCAVANDHDFDAVAVPLRHGVLIGRKRADGSKD